MTLPHAILHRWLVKVGDRVEVHQVVAQVGTELAIVEVPAHASGVVVALGVDQGRPVPAGWPLLTIG